MLSESLTQITRRMVLTLRVERSSQPQARLSLQEKSPPTEPEKGEESPPPLAGPGPFPSPGKPLSLPAFWLPTH